MKNIFIQLTLVFCFFTILFSSVKGEDLLTLHGQIQFNDDGNGAGGSDVWGYTTPEGEDYAIMGIYEGVAFIRVEDMAIVDTVLGPMDNDSYYHRDIQTFGHYAYVVSENLGTNEGLQIIDMSNLPNQVELVNVTTFNNNPRSHNLHIDVEMGFAYVCAPNHDGFRVLDLSNPEIPSDVSFVDTDHIHDVYARNDTAYTAEGGRGTFAIYDMMNKSNPVLLARVAIPNSGYVHNIWPSDDGKYVITTEETIGKTIKIWSIEDMANIHVIGEYLGDNLIAHNAQVMGSRIFLSHYSYGIAVVDFANPNDPILSGYWDTSLADNDQPSPWLGTWGVYPYTENGYVYGSDLNGLFTVLNYEKGLDNYLLGDVNEDHSVDNLDFNFILDAVLNNYELTDAQWLRANLNFDESIDVLDLLLLADQIEF
jgi:choice-of-anchor B domain-containing protein